ncbi:hypothetical protein EST38_g6029 [Candolleomyces aberdarensis]|uniref:C2H2-type domain-containing protein n=1 Tax=Candolleomyces aberdarensis TaxID=2316362 RepID=A0A4Q2DIT9_9AGAR|nr:hypothetical protein EST38_g6029 [Candolleomyces aberdarensis]
MRFAVITAVLASFFAMSLANSGESQDLQARSPDDFVLDARELLEDLGMHARALKGAALSARRLEQLEARMLDLEADLDELVVRGPKAKPKAKAKSDPYVCPTCDATFADSGALRSHRDLMGHWPNIAPAQARPRRRG